MDGVFPSLSLRSSLRSRKWKEILPATMKPSTRLLKPSKLHARRYELGRYRTYACASRLPPRLDPEIATSRVVGWLICR
jgi:hypothetical protein